MASTQQESSKGRVFTAEDRQRAREAQAARHAADLARQASERITVDGYTIQPAIGRTGGADNIGWELIPAEGRPWYLRTKAEALDAIPRHRTRVAPQSTGVGP